ncbi:uncharacterized protein PV07_06589 [Cladophialophora immunda]|uniref:Uncharacterized protein n=1 Tax=Cladophialophora immunda TaxID=569365 RepID=A0A0D1ZG01_9EURO|nr:uncharacterized protein PV07_06589 [Cladophialophora immunda]KIW26781.1 hypothetical protein PV07_06589 [Cladophialophora immunda]OQV05261.1 hypothetical protein CLAIMM_10030 [Cladophialophora immunda]
MASTLAQSQLSKSLSVNAPGVVAPGPNTIPTTMSNPPPQQPFPDYALGYDPTADVKSITQAVPPRPPNGQHSAHPFHMLSETNLHPILFQLQPYPSTLNGVVVPLLVNQATNQIELDNKGRHLRYFSHLPRWIAHNVSGMFMELWLRLDPRVEVSDIMARVHLPPGTKMPQVNTFNMRRLRFREYLQAPPFSASRQYPTAMEVDLMAKKTREQLLLNTCMTVDVPNNRLLKPVLNNDKSVAGFVDSGLPIDYFLGGYAMPVPIPSDHQMVVLELRKRMQTLALRRGLGNGPEDYRQVPTALDPAWWLKGQARDVIISDVDNKTHDQWIAEMLEQYPGVTRPVGHLSVPTLQVQPQPPLSQPGVNAPQPATAGVAQPAPTAPMSPVDPRFAGNGAAALAAAPVSPQSFTNAEGCTSYYVEDVHRAEYEAAEAARSQLE